MKRISKTAARKLYSEGKMFWMTAANMRPECGLLINYKKDDEPKDFDKLYNAFVYYNCNNECGRYPAYYIE